MILVCESCSTSLQLDEKKAPSGKFTVRCPKCKSLVSVNVPVGNQHSSENGAAQSTTTGAPAEPAARYKPPQAAGSNSAAPTADASEDLMRLLAGLLNQKGASFDNSATDAETSVLLCLSSEQREKTAHLLSENGWQPFIAENPAQAMETLNEVNIGNVVVTSNFAPEQRGAQALISHFQTLTPARRRNIFLVFADERPQSGSVYDAFLRNLNLVVNIKDLPNLPHILRRERRDFDESYRNYKNALTAV